MNRKESALQEVFIKARQARRSNWAVIQLRRGGHKSSAIGENIFYRDQAMKDARAWKRKAANQ